MVCVTKFRRLVWFRVEILTVCLLAWSRPFAMAENSIVDSGVKGMSCSMPVNPFKPTNPFTPASDSSVNYFGSPSRRFHSANPFAPESDTDHNSADLFTQCRKFNKPVKNPADYDGSQSLRDYLRDTLSVAQLLMVGAKMKLPYFWPQAFAAKLKKC